MTRMTFQNYAKKNYNKKTKSCRLALEMIQRSDKKAVSQKL